MKRGLHFFQKYAPHLLAMLGYLSLPYCYAAANGAQVLQLSQRIRQDTKKRLLETSQFVLDVMEPGAFGPEGLGLVSALKVRLIHAAIRFHVLRSPKWDMAWGLPVNQEDMGGTNGAFSWISVRPAQNWLPTR
ncbi:MAG: DUF2236 domain-containing protein [Bacteroidia bacterium]|nr:DUF2236 domain-containing protein [Bacteroidia bacterium]